MMSASGPVKPIPPAIGRTKDVLTKGLRSPARTGLGVISVSGYTNNQSTLTSAQSTYTNNTNSMIVESPVILCVDLSGNILSETEYVMPSVVASSGFVKESSISTNMGARVTYNDQASIKTAVSPAFQCEGFEDLNPLDLSPNRLFEKDPGQALFRAYFQNIHGVRNTLAQTFFTPESLYPGNIPSVTVTAADPATDPPIVEVAMRADTALEVAQWIRDIKNGFLLWIEPYGLNPPDPGAVSLPQGNQSLLLNNLSTILFAGDKTATKLSDPPTDAEWQTMSNKQNDIIRKLLNANRITIIQTELTIATDHAILADLAHASMNAVVSPPPSVTVNGSSLQIAVQGGKAETMLMKNPINFVANGIDYIAVFVTNMTGGGALTLPDGRKVYAPKSSVNPLPNQVLSTAESLPAYTEILMRKRGLISGSLLPIRVVSERVTQRAFSTPLARDYEVATINYQHALFPTLKNQLCAMIRGLGHHNSIPMMPNISSACSFAWDRVHFIPTSSLVNGELGESYVYGKAHPCVVGNLNSRLAAISF